MKSFDELLFLNIASGGQFEFPFPESDLENVTNIRLTFARTFTKKGCRAETQNFQTAIIINTCWLVQSAF